jgi:hypothetical protein
MIGKPGASGGSANTSALVSDYILKIRKEGT